MKETADTIVMMRYVPINEYFQTTSMLFTF